MNLSWKSATLYGLLGFTVVTLGVFSGMRLNEVLRNAKTPPPAKTA